VGAGLGATAQAVLAPVGGHGKDAKLELGGVNKMIKMTLAGTEGGTFPIGTFRQAGVIHKPLCADQGSKITVESTNGFEAGSIITGDTSGATGVIRLLDANERVIWVDTVVGAFLQSESVLSLGHSAPVQRVDNNTSLVLVSSVAPGSSLVVRTGDVLYISNRQFINRNDTQSEEIRFIIGF
jgi:hypothetical protein